MTKLLKGLVFATILATSMGCAHYGQKKCDGKKQCDVKKSKTKKCSGKQCKLKKKKACCSKEKS